VKTYRVLPLLFLFAAIGVSTARSDTITITSGVLAVGPGVLSGGTVTLTGEGGFTFTGELGASGNLGAKTCTPCTPGTAIPLIAQWGGLDLPGVATFGGVTFSDLNGLNSPNSLIITLAGAPIVAPPLTPGDVVLTAPVTLGGSFVHPPDADALSGTGLATLTLGHPADPDLWLARSFRVDLGPTAVTPEPASAILFGSGLALLLGRARRRIEP
jgi:hypothetical protein